MNQIPDEREVRILAEQAGFRHNDAMQIIITRLYFDPDEDDVRDIVELAHLFQTLIRRDAKEKVPFLSPSAELLRAGRLFLGTLPGYREALLLSTKGHMYCAAASGAGKSTVAEIVMAEAYAQGLSVIALDSEGEFLRRMGGLIAQDDLCRVDHRSLFVNPLDGPKNIDPLDWIGIIGNIDREAWYFRRGSEDLSNWIKSDLLNRGHELNLESFMEAVNAYRPTSRFREAEWLHSVKSVTRTIRDFLPSLRTRRSGGFEKIFSHRFVVCDWSGIHNITLRRYLTLLVLNWAMAARADDPHREADTLLVWDEVHQYASTDIQNQTDIAEPFAAVVLRQSRKRGFCVLALDQHPAKTMLVVRGARTKIVMELSEGRDINTIVTDLNLSPEQRDYLAVLPPRQAIVKTLLIPEPFLVEIPEVSFG